MTEAEWFLQTLFGDHVDSNALISIWTMPDKQTMFFENPTDAAEFGTSLAETHDVYVGTCLYRSGIKRGRGKAEDVTKLVTLWADADFGKHTKNVPPDEEAARKVLDRVGIRPLVVVASGHGLHAYWPVREPVVNRTRASEWARRWSDTMRAVARSVGDWELDSVGDLARVLRLPGTLNHKDTPPLRVTVTGDIDLSEPGVMAYDIEDLGQWIVDDEFGNVQSAALVKVSSALILTEDRRISDAIIGGWIENDLRFKKTWRRERKDLKDTSPSGYHMALANYGDSLGLSDQQTADLIIHWQRQQRENMRKVCRLDYIQATIGKARKSKRSDTAIDALNLSTGGNGVIDALRAALGLPVDRWIQHGRENPDYSLILDGGRDIPIGPVENVTAPTGFRNRVYAVVGVLIPRVTPGRWDGIVKNLASIVEVIEAPETTRVGRLGGWLVSYLMMRQPRPEEEYQDAANSGHPFVRGDMLYVWGNQLRSHIKNKLDERVTIRELGEMFRADGWTRYTQTVTINERVTSRGYWRKTGDKRTAAMRATADGGSTQAVDKLAPWVKVPIDDGEDNA